MQPYEFYLLWDGYRWRQEQQENMLAYFTCQLMNISGKSLKRAITPKEILKPLQQKTKKQNKADDEAYLKKQFALILEGGGNNGSNNS